MANGNDDIDKELLKKYIKDIDQIFDSDEEVPDTKKIDTVLRSVRLILIFIMGDHPKTSLMWRTFVPASWILTLLAGAFLTLLATGHAKIIVIP